MREKDKVIYIFIEKKKISSLSSWTMRMFPWQKNSDNDNKISNHTPIHTEIILPGFVLALKLSLFTNEYDVVCVCV